ncbi:hypothetical protein N431DRAFT_510629 [Stipitochalara longipes BDJ]|nr:hypothetical protein N431DRAFT_510629 [Stipitochalara longipes BDJ]
MEYHRTYRLRLNGEACPVNSNTSEMEKQLDVFWQADWRESLVCEVNDHIGYTVFATDKGQLGVGPGSIEEGDFLWEPELDWPRRGDHSYYVLRERESEDGYERYGVRLARIMCDGRYHPDARRGIEDPPGTFRPGTTSAIDEPPDFDGYPDTRPEIDVNISRPLLQALTYPWKNRGAIFY